MNLLKKAFVFLLAAVLCLSLTACGDSGPDVESDIGESSDEPDPGGGGDRPDIAGADWRTTGIWRGDGTITRDGEDTDVLVCIHKANATFYYDREEQVLFDSVDYPITLEGDPWEMFWSIDFADLNGDGNSDVTMRFDDGGNELLMVWFWDTESEQFMYQPDE